MISSLICLSSLAQCLFTLIFSDLTFVERHQNVPETKLKKNPLKKDTVTVPPVLHNTFFLIVIMGVWWRPHHRTPQRRNASEGQAGRLMRYRCGVWATCSFRLFRLSDHGSSVLHTHMAWYAVTHWPTFPVNFPPFHRIGRGWCNPTFS